MSKSGDDFWLRGSLLCNESVDKVMESRVRFGSGEIPGGKFAH